MLEDGKHVRRCLISTQSTKLAGGKDLGLSWTSSWSGPLDLCVVGCKVKFMVLLQGADEDGHTKHTKKT